MIFDWMIPKKERQKYLREIKRKFKNPSESLPDSGQQSYSNVVDRSSVSDSASALQVSVAFQQSNNPPQESQREAASKISGIETSKKHEREIYVSGQEEESPRHELRA